MKIIAMVLPSKPGSSVNVQDYCNFLRIISHGVKMEVSWPPGKFTIWGKKINSHES